MNQGLPHGGWCPAGRLCEGGKIPFCYELMEMPTKSYPARTEKNILESDGTAIISSKSNLTGGSRLTLQLAKKHKKPVIHVHFDTFDAGSELARFVLENGIAVLNVAGPRASGDPHVRDFTRGVLEGMLAELRALSRDCSSPAQG